METERKCHRKAKLESREHIKNYFTHDKMYVSNHDDEQEEEEEEQQEMELNEKMVSFFVTLRENDDDGEDVLQC